MTEKRLRVLKNIFNYFIAMIVLYVYQEFGNVTSLLRHIRKQRYYDASLTTLSD